MRLGSMLAMVSVATCLAVPMACAETLEQLVKKEEGVELGVCNLTPKPDLAGIETYVVIPARFANLGIWVTRSILLVGVDEGKNVAGTLELKALNDIPPREVVSVSCNKSVMTIRMSNRMKQPTLSYMWNGKELKRPGGKK